MSATVVLDSKAGDDTKVVIRPDLKRNGVPKPTDEEVAKYGPIRMCVVVFFCLGLIGMLIAAIVIIAISPRCVSVAPKAPDVWWKSGQYYNIYVQSFQDTKNDGFGDLNGVAKRIPFLKEIGAKVIVLSGVANSKNLTTVDARVGSENDLKELIKLLHSSNMKVILSLNPVYTDDSHPWFIASKSSQGSKREYYIWSKKINNWKSKVRSSAWSFDSTSNEYFYSYYVSTKPMLNYRNPDVRKMMGKSILRWVEVFGVDGLKLEGVERLIVDSQLRDSTANTDYTKDQPETHTILKTWNQLVAKHGTVLVGVPDSKNASNYFGTSSEKELHVVMHNYLGLVKPLPSAPTISTAINSYISEVPVYAWPAWVLGGPEYSRVVARLGKLHAKLLNVMLLTLPGAIMPYYGDEIMLDDVDYQSTTVMQWNNQTNAGFSKAKAPWKKIPASYLTNNVQSMTGKNSILEAFKIMSNLRAKERALSGLQFDVLKAAGNVFVYYRSFPGANSFVIALNFGSKTVTNISLAHNKIVLDKGRVVFDTEFLLTGKENGLKTLTLKDGQGLVVKVNPDKNM